MTRRPPARRRLAGELLEVLAVAVVLVLVLALVFTWPEWIAWSL